MSKILNDTTIKTLLARIKAACVSSTNVESATLVSIDSAPTLDSENLVESGGVYDAIEDLEDVYVSKEDVSSSTLLTIDTSPTSGSNNLVTSGGVYAMIGNVESALATIIGES